MGGYGRWLWLRAIVLFDRAHSNSPMSQWHQPEMNELHNLVVDAEYDFFHMVQCGTSRSIVIDASHRTNNSQAVLLRLGA